jgi:DNA-binding transcriptional LysR family regulator
VHSSGSEGDGGADSSFRLGFVPGATPAKWARVWQQRHRDVPLELVPISAEQAERAVIDGDLDAAILRPPVDRDALHAIVLYAEEPVVVVSRDHAVAALDDDEAVEPADLADDVLLQPAHDVLAWAGRPGAAQGALALPGRPPVEVPQTTVDAIELVAAGVGVVVVPRSLARLHHRKDVTARALLGAPEAPVALAWAIDREDERTEDLIGIVRGRTVNSSRGRPQQPPPAPPRTEPAQRASRDGRRGARPSRRGGRRSR